MQNAVHSINTLTNKILTYFSAYFRCGSKSCFHLFAFLQQQEYQQLMTYKRLAPVLRKQIKKKERLDEQTLHAFQHANPHFFYVYELLGDYYHATGQQDKALRNWKKALLLPIPKRSESERIEHKINN